jgi:hypothetical protein
MKEGIQIESKQDPNQNQEISHKIANPESVKAVTTMSPLSPIKDPENQGYGAFPLLSISVASVDVLVPFRYLS